LKVNLHNFSEIKSPKEVTKQQDSKFFLLFLLDDRRIRIHTLTRGSGSGSRRPKNILVWIRWIRHHRAPLGQTHPGTAQTAVSRGVPRGDAQDARASPLPPLCIPPPGHVHPPPPPQPERLLMRKDEAVGNKKKMQVCLLAC
jgi:hypothetical protein